MSTNQVAKLNDDRKDALSKFAKLPETTREQLEGVAIGLLLAYEKQAKSEKA